MSLRTFVDSGGSEWNVFDVVPRTDDRRGSERRGVDNASAGAAETLADRRDSDRRITVGEIAHFSTISEGWLCFERGSDRRRLSPIPGDWRRCTDACLEQYCRLALPGRSLRRDLIEH